MAKRTVRLSKEFLEIERLLYPESIPWRPRIRAECGGVPRPCPYVGCKYNTFLEVSSIGTIFYKRMGDEPWDTPPDQSCVLDMAENNGMTLEEIGDVFGITRERVRQIEEKAFEKATFEEIFPEPTPQYPNPLRLVK